MDETFLSAFLSMESDYAAATSLARINWATESEASFPTAGPSISFGDIGVTPNNAVIAPMQDGISWIDSSLLAASGTIIMNIFILRHSRPLLILLPGYIYTSDVQITPVHAMTMALAPPFVSPCGIVGNMPCNQPLDGTLVSIRWHLSMHGYNHQGREMVQCPWAGCSDKLRWMNIPRHIRSIHLGVRMVCPTCERSFTRSLGLAKHVASSRKCSVVSGLHYMPIVK
jgi:uncharacterized protein (DUF983 family)